MMTTIALSHRAVVKAHQSDTTAYVKLDQDCGELLIVVRDFAAATALADALEAAKARNYDADVARAERIISNSSSANSPAR